jgi:methyl-accepting chemotaxis protein
MKRDVGHSTTGSAAQEVLGSATKLPSQSEVLRNEVDRFLASIRAA